ncbi:MAG: hypothetical protein RIC56_12360 [Pseudomonadales bacterium]
MRWFYIAAVIRAPATLTSLLLLGLLSACTTLPPGVQPVPDDDPAAGLLTLPAGRSVVVLPDELDYTGRARLEWPDGRVYDGDWVDGRPHGLGVEQTPDGSRYRGAWRNGHRDGHGILELADGQRYEGAFVAGQREGQGTLTGPDGEYRGQWAADVPDGEGAFEASDGTWYRGQWRDGQRFGEGSYRSIDGSVYEGAWVNDQPYGFGRLERPEGAHYEGEWRQGRQHGYGREEGPPGLVYEGTWAEGERHGYGEEQRPDGSRYVGEWRAGKRHGQGREEHPDGSFHEGMWELNQPLGPGYRRAPSGIEISGLWNNDAVSTGLLVLPSGPEYAGPLFGDANRIASGRLRRWLHTTAGRGDPYAQLLLGTLYLDYQEPAPDVGVARRWLSRAAAVGIAEAQFRLALTYENENPPRVVELLAEAARQDHVGANETLAEYYYGGITVPRSLERARGYYERAVARGSVPARNNLAWLLATANEPELRDGERAVALIRGVALSSGAWQYLDTLAAAWAAAGEFDRAVLVAERAIAIAQRELAGDTLGEVALLERRLDGYRNRHAYVEAAP